MPPHSHANCSPQDGVCSIERLTGAAAAIGMPAVTVTEHANLIGAVRL